MDHDHRVEVELRSIIDRAIARPMHREVVWRHLVEGASSRAVARELGVTPVNVRVILHRSAGSVLNALSVLVEGRSAARPSERAHEGGEGHV